MFAPPVALSGGPLGEVQAADREIGRQTALRARAVARFAATRPATADRAQGEPGARSAERWSARPEVLRSPPTSTAGCAPETGAAGHPVADDACPRGGELDHHRPYPAGPPSAQNLAGYCTSDHRGKYQAPGWQHRLDADGTLSVTTPTGLVAVTTPPPY